jgi:hypothetical protein
MSMKNSNDAIGNQSRDLPVCSAVPEPTALRMSQVFNWSVCESLSLGQIELTRHKCDEEHQRMELYPLNYEVEVLNWKLLGVRLSTVIATDFKIPFKQVW